MTKSLIVLLAALLVITSSQVTPVPPVALNQGEVSFFTLLPKASKEFTFNVNTTDSTFLVFNGQSLNKEDLNWELQGPTKQIVKQGIYNDKSSVSTTLYRAALKDFDTLCPVGQKEACPLFLIVYNQDTSDTVNATAQFIFESAPSVVIVPTVNVTVTDFAPISYDDATKNLEALSVGYSHVHNNNSNVEYLVSRYQIYASQAVNTTAVLNFKQAFTDNSSFAIVVSQVADPALAPVNYTYPVASDEQLTQLVSGPGLNPYFHAFLGACEGNTTCNWVVSVYVATFRNVSKKTEGNGFYVEVKDVADFELIQQANSTTSQNTSSTINQVFLYFRVQSEKKYVGLYVDDDDDDDIEDQIEDKGFVLNHQLLPSYVLSIVDENKFQVIKEFFKEGGYRIINEGQRELFIFFYGEIDDDKDEKEVDFSDFEEDLNDLDKDIDEDGNHGIHFSDNKTAYILYTVSEYRASGLELTFSANQNFNEVLKGTKIHLIVCDTFDLCVFPDDDEQSDSTDEETSQFEIQEDEDDKDNGQVFLNRTLQKDQVIAMKLTLSQPMDIEKLRSLEVKLSIKEDVKNEQSYTVYFILFFVVSVVSYILIRKFCCASKQDESSFVPANYAQLKGKKNAKGDDLELNTVK